MSEATKERKELIPSAGSAFRMIPMHKTLAIKKPCPYCDGKLTVQAEEWEEDEHGWYATGLYMDCDSEPDIDSDEWWEWDSWHGQSDYHEEWVDLIERILATLKKQVRFYEQNVERSCEG